MKDLLKYGLIASAGQPRNLTGEAFIGLGALLAQMDFNLGKGKNEENQLAYVKGDEKEGVTDAGTLTNQLKDGFEEFRRSKTNNPANVIANDTTQTVITDEDFLIPPDKDSLIPPDEETQINAAINQKTNFGTQNYGDDFIFGQNQVQNFMQSEAYAKSSQKDKQDINRALKTIKGKGANINAPNVYIGNKMPNVFFDFMKMPRPERGVTNDSQGVAVGGRKIAKRSFYSMPLNEQKRYVQSQGSNWTGKYGQYDSLLKRLKPEVLQILENGRYRNKGKEDTPLHRIAHITKSPYLRTDNVDYRQMRQATAPGYTGEIGKAAIEGYNLVIDKYNYDQAVKADYEEEIEDQMGSLNVEADFLTDQARQDYLELSMGKKKRLNEAFNSYSNGDISKLDYENVKASLVSELQSAAATRTNITNAIKDFIENKGTIDAEASDSEMLDFLMTGEKSPERISIKNIDGVDYVTGTTRGGRGFQIPTSKIANGTAGFRVVKKASLAPVISGALKNINAYTSTVKTDLGFGVSTPNPEKARDIGIASIKTNLGSNEADLRSIMAQIYGVDHTAYQNFLGSDPTANKSAMLDDAAEYLYDTQVAEKYFPMTKTTKFKTEKTGGTTAGEREKAQFVKDWNSAALPTNENIISEYTGLLSEKYRIQELKDGNFGIVKTDDPKAGIKKIDMSKSPSDIKQQLLDFAQFRVKTGETQQDLSLYNFEL